MLYDLFIENGRKCIKEELFHYIDGLVLAYWIMSDGVSNKYGLRICTDSYTLKEVVLLINILKIKFDLNCTLHTIISEKGSKLFRIYIRSESMDKLKKLVNPYIISFSKYKLSKIKRWNEFK